MMTQAVGYISGRPEVLCATFFLLAVLSGRRWMLGPSWKWGVSTIGSWTLAIASKEIAAILPLVLVSYDWLLLPRPRIQRRRRVLAVHLPLIGAALLIAAIRVTVLAILEHRGATLPDWRLALVELEVLGRYAWLFVWPVGQTVFHAIPPIASPLAPRALVAVFTVGIAIALAWVMRRRHAVAAFGIFWFLLLLVPSSVLVMLDRGEPMAEHRTYLAGCGLFMTAGWLASWIIARVSETHPHAKRIVYVMSAIVIVGLGGRTVIRNTVWGAPVRLWLEAAEQAPDHWLPRLALGDALHQTGRREEAIREYRAAIARRPQEPIAHTKLAHALAEVGRFEEATVVLEQLRARHPKSPIAFNALGGVALLAGDIGRARSYFQQALARDPQNTSARQALAALDEGGSQEVGREAR
jgi:Flp pilus assembly protein TadD